MGSVIWKITFGITLDFDHPNTMEFRKLRQAVSILKFHYFLFENMTHVIENYDNIIPTGG